MMFTLGEWQAIIDAHKCRNCIYTDDQSDGQGVLVDSGKPLDKRERVDLCDACMLNVIRDVWRHFTAPETERERWSFADGETAWLVYFEDQDKRPEVFTGRGAEAGAKARFLDARQAWSCHLFYGVAWNVPSAMTPTFRGPAAHSPAEVTETERLRRRVHESADALIALCLQDVDPDGDDMAEGWYEFTCALNAHSRRRPHKGAGVMWTRDSPGEPPSPNMDAGYDEWCDRNGMNEPDDDDGYGCETCWGEGVIVVCIDDMCSGSDTCIHGDGYAPCPNCAARTKEPTDGK